MKRIVACLLALLLAGLFGCSSRQEAPAPTLTVGLVASSGGVAEDTLSSVLWRALQDLAAQDNAIRPLLQEPAAGGYQAAITALETQGAELIVCVGDPAAKALSAAAQTDPARKYVFYGTTFVDLPNVACPVFDRVQAAYLAGAAAGKLSQSAIVCCMQGRFSAENTPEALAFAAGVCSVDQDAAVLRATTFGDADGGAADTVDMVSRGVDVIYHTEDVAQSAVLRTCGAQGIWGIGAWYDRSSTEGAAASVVNRVDIALQELVRAVQAGTFTGGKVHYAAANNGIDLQLQADQLPGNVTNAVSSARNRLKEGTAFLPETLEALREKYPEARLYYD